MVHRFGIYRDCPVSLRIGANETEISELSGLTRKSHHVRGDFYGLMNPKIPYADYVSFGIETDNYHGSLSDFRFVSFADCVVQVIRLKSELLTLGMLPASFTRSESPSDFEPHHVF